MVSARAINAVGPRRDCAAVLYLGGVWA